VAIGNPFPGPKSGRYSTNILQILHRVTRSESAIPVNQLLSFTDGETSRGVLYDVQHDLLRQLAEGRHLGNAVEVPRDEGQAHLFHVVKWREILGSIAVDVDHVVDVNNGTQATETQRLHTGQGKPISN